MKNALKTWAFQKGIRIAALRISALTEACEAIRDLEVSGALDQGFFQKQLRWIFKKPRMDLSDYRSIILIGVPRPAHKLIFRTASGDFDCIIPPTYLHYRRTGTSMLADLLGFMGKDFPKTRICSAPLKTLAVRSGFASYGKNNITYLGGYGSFYQLCGFISKADLAPFIDRGQKAERRLKECEHCRACMSSCPTGAISPKRFLLHAEKCLTLFTETRGNIPQVQDRLKNNHCCVVGCLVCQAVCPVNRGKLRMEDAPVSFDLNETDRIISDSRDRSGSTWRGIREKLGLIGMRHYECFLSRNLRFAMSI